MADSGEGTGVDPGMGTINPLDPTQVQLQSNLQEWGLQGINPALFQAYLNQYMKDQQGQGDTPGSAMQLLQDYLKSVQGQQPDQTQQILDDVFGKGVSGAQKVTQAADKLFGQKRTGDIADGPKADTFQQGYNKQDQPAKKDDTPAPATDKAPASSADSSILGVPPALNLGVNTNLGGAIPEGVATAGQPTIQEFGPTMGGSIGISGAAPQAAAPLATGGTELQLGPGGLSLGGVPTSYSPSSLLGQGAGPTPLGGASLDTSGITADTAAPTAEGVTGGAGVLGNIGAGLGALGGGYGLYNAFAGKGSPAERAMSGLTGAYGLYSGLNTLGGFGLPTASSVAGTIGSGISDLMAGGAFGSGAGAATAAGATGAGEIAGPAIASGAEAGAAGAEAGVGALGASAGLVAAPLAAIALTGLINSLIGEKDDPMAQIFGYGGKPAGYSKYVSGQRELASQLYDAAAAQNKSAQGEYAGIPSGSSAGGLQAVGGDLMSALDAYFKPNATGLGPSSHVVDPNAPNPFRDTQSELLNVDAALKQLGLRPVPLGGDIIRGYGLDIPTNVSAMNAVEGTAPDWGKIGPPPGGDTSNQDWLQQRFQDYSTTAGLGTDPSEIARILSGVTSGSTVGGGGGAPGAPSGGLRSGGGSDPEKNLPGAAAATNQAALGAEANPWAQKTSGLTLQPLQTLDDLLAKAQAMGSGQA